MRDIKCYKLIDRNRNASFPEFITEETYHKQDLFLDHYYEPVYDKTLKWYLEDGAKWAILRDPSNFEEVNRMANEMFLSNSFNYFDDKHYITGTENNNGVQPHYCQELKYGFNRITLSQLREVYLVWKAKQGKSVTSSIITDSQMLINVIRINEELNQTITDLRNEFDEMENQRDNEARDNGVHEHEIEQLKATIADLRKELERVIAIGKDQCNEINELKNELASDKLEVINDNLKSLITKVELENDQLRTELETLRNDELRRVSKDIYVIQLASKENIGSKYSNIADWSIGCAKKLITQLNKESK